MRLWKAPCGSPELEIFVRMDGFFAKSSPGCRVSVTCGFRGMVNENETLLVDTEIMGLSCISQVWPDWKARRPEVVRPKISLCG